MRKMRFRCAMGIYFLKESPCTCIELLFARLRPPTFSHGIQLVDNKLRTRDTFMSAIDSALELIKQTSPPLFNRVKKEIRRIYHLPCSGGKYKRSLRLCVIDLEKHLAIVTEENSADAILATTLIHEATHGYLYSRGIKYSKSTHQRIEKICVKEENKFARMIGSEEYPVESYEYPSFSERFKEVRQDFRRIWKS